jgi:hypothetical protein
MNIFIRLGAAAASSGWKRFASKAAGLGGAAIRDIAISAAALGLWDYLAGNSEGAKEKTSSSEPFIKSKEVTLTEGQVYTDHAMGAECKAFVGQLAFLDYVLEMSPNLQTDLKIISMMYAKSADDMLLKGFLIRLKYAVLQTGGFNTSLANVKMVAGVSAFISSVVSGTSILAAAKNPADVMSTNFGHLSCVQLVKGIFSTTKDWGVGSFADLAASEAQFANSNEFESDDATSPNSYSEIKGGEAGKGRKLLDALRRVFDFADNVYTTAGEMRDVYAHLAPILKRVLENFLT